MAVQKKKVAKKRTTTTRTSGVSKYQRFIKNKPAVKSAEARIKKTEKALLMLKKKKASAVKIAQKLYKKKNKC